jgi:mono/diheme cytochrome c family protein
MNRKIKIIANGLLAMMVALLLVTCSSHPHMMIAAKGTDRGTETLPSSGSASPESIVVNSTDRGTGAFRSNGERIYFTSSSDRGTNITSTGVPSAGLMNGGSSGGMMGNGSSGGMMGNGSSGGMMGNGSSGGMMGNGSSGGMMGNGNLTCASCHGADGRGGVHTMMGMQTMKSPDIRWSTLKREFDAKKFRLAVTQGQDPDGKKQLNQDMPRWNIGNDDLADLITYLKTLP